MPEMTNYRLSTKCPKSKRFVLPQYNNLTEKQREEIVELFKTGDYSFSKLAKLYGKHITSISYLLNKRGFKAIPQTKLQRKHSINDNYFDEIDTFDKAYMLGFLYADGYNNEKNNKVSISLSSNDRCLLERFSIILNSGAPIRDYKVKTKLGKIRSYSKMDVNSLNISQKLSFWGVEQNKTFKIRFPFFLKKELWSSFVRGYFDGDGCVFISEKYKNNMVTSFTSNKLFLEDLMSIFVNELGLNNVKISTASNSDERIGVLPYSGRNNCIKIRDWMYQYDTISLSRKKEKLYSI